jgi:hypothetical protein
VVRIHWGALIHTAPVRGTKEVYAAPLPFLTTGNAGAFDNFGSAPHGAIAMPIPATFESTVSGATFPSASFAKMLTVPGC